MRPTPRVTEGTGPFEGDGAHDEPHRGVEVLVVTVTYNSALLLADFIATLGPGMSGLSYQLVVVDNDSVDGSLDLAARICPESVRVQTGRNAGYAAGINAGVDAGGPSRAILVLNPDVRLRPGCGTALFAALMQSEVGVTAPRLETADGELLHSIRREPTIRRLAADALVGGHRAGRLGDWGEVVASSREYGRSHPVDWVEGSTMMIDREVWDLVGTWDESFFLYSEETDYALRVKDAGLQVVFVAEATAVHLRGGSAGSIRLWPLVTLNKWRLFSKRHGRAPSVIFWALLLVREGSRAALGKPANAAAARALLSRRQLLERPGPHSIR